MAALLALCALLSCRGTSPVSVRSCATARYVLGAQERRRKVPFSGFVKSSQRGPHLALPTVLEAYQGRKQVIQHRIGVICFQTPQDFRVSTPVDRLGPLKPSL
jgi:hypothetical protein